MRQVEQGAAVRVPSASTAPVFARHVEGAARDADGCQRGGQRDGAGCDGRQHPRHREHHDRDGKDRVPVAVDQPARRPHRRQGTDADEGDGHAELAVADPGLVLDVGHESAPDAPPGAEATNAASTRRRMAGRVSPGSS